MSIQDNFDLSILLHFQKNYVMKKYISIGLRLIVAALLIQTLQYKFTAHPDSVYIFSKVGLEPYGRIGIGFLELVAGVMILIPRTVWLGTILTLGIIGGAIFMHLTILGIEVQNDGGSLFFLALLVFGLSLGVLGLHRKEIPVLKKYIHA